MPGYDVRRTARRGAVLAAAVLGLLGAGTLTPVVAAPTPIATPTPSATTPALTPVALPWTPPPALTPPAGVIAGYDISWTQCGAAQGGFANPMPGSNAQFVVVGLSSGRAFTTNPCLADELTLARTRHLLTSAYVFPTYPTNEQYASYGAKGPYSTKTAKGRLMNVGWAQAAYWTAAAKKVGFRTPMVWVDVEKRATYYKWTDRPADRNLPVLQGLLAGLKHYGFRTGIYAPSAHWKEITGGVRLGLPEWSTVGTAGPAAALATCGKPGFQGSPVLMAQYYPTDKKVDYDALCPIMSNRAYRLRFFRQN